MTSERALPTTLHQRFPIGWGCSVKPQLAEPLDELDAATPVAVHAVQHLVHTPRHLDAWPGEDRRSRLVFIARGLDPAVIERSFRAFSMPQKRNGS